MIFKETGLTGVLRSIYDADPIIAYSTNIMEIVHVIVAVRKTPRV